MQEVLYRENFKGVLERELRDVQNNLQIISAYCKLSALEFVDTKIKAQPKTKRLMVRFRPDDILSGATDFEIYEFCKAHDWELYIQLDIHAKTYVFDKKRWIVGSANLTSKGIGVGAIGNDEMAVLVDVDDSEYEKISNMFHSATIMTDELAHLMKLQLSNATRNGRKNIDWGDDITQLLNDNITTLFQHDFPNADSPYPIQKEDALLLGIDAHATLSQIKHCFIKSRCFKWLLSVLRSSNEKQLYFGTLTVALHEILINNPVPHRKEVKDMLSKLLNWIVMLEIDCISVERPNYSQLVKLIEL